MIGIDPKQLLEMTRTDLEQLEHKIRVEYMSQPGLPRILVDIADKIKIIRCG